MDKLEKIMDAFGRVPENAWGYGVLLLAAVLALIAHGTADKDLYGVASAYGMTGAAIMHAKKE